MHALLEYPSEIVPLLLLSLTAKDTFSDMPDVCSAIRGRVEPA